MFMLWVCKTIPNITECIFYNITQLNAMNRILLFLVIQVSTMKEKLTFPPDSNSISKLILADQPSLQGISNYTNCLLFNCAACVDASTMRISNSMRTHIMIKQLICKSSALIYSQL